MKSSTLTVIAGVLCGCGFVALIVSMFRAAHAHGGPLLWVAFALLVGTVACWFAAARVQGQSG